MNQFEQLYSGQVICFFLAGALAAWTLIGHGISVSAVPSLAVCAILGAVGWLGPQIVHELSEINDQLAGRSKELHQLLSTLKSPRP